MIGYRKRDGLEPTIAVLSSLQHVVTAEIRRGNVLKLQLILFGALFLTLVGGETLFATMMFAIISIEIMGVVFSGAAFALLVPTVIGYAHVRLHHEGDHFINWWLNKLSGIGILIFALGMSMMIGFSAWQASQAAVDAIATSPAGTIGGQSVGADTETSSGLAGWIAVIPNGLLFLGLSFGMIINIAFASFSLGRALVAFNMLMLVPRIGDEVRDLIAAGHDNIAKQRKLIDEEEADLRKRPLDLKVKFANLAANAAWKVGQTKLAAARRTFDPVRGNDALTSVVGDPVRDSIPGHCKTAQDYDRHFADVMDEMRAHNLLRVLTGMTE